MALHVHRSNRMEALADALARVVGGGAGSPLEAEHIVVQSRAMERWVSLELASRLGIWANPRFPFPRRFLEGAMAAVLGMQGRDWEPFLPDVLAWGVAGILPAHLGLESFAPLRRYVGDDESMLVRLSERIAQAFDRYAVYRPAMVLDWEAGGGEGWQPELWRAIVAEHGSVHFASRARAFARAWEGLRSRPAGVPARASFFAVSTLPPAYASVLAALAGRMDVHLFLLEPSRDPGGSHRLLSSMGKQVRERAGTIEEACAGARIETLFVPPGEDTVLGRIQSALLSGEREVRRRRGVPGGGGLAGDGSIEIHSCHGPVREVEALRDILVDIFETRPEVGPGDVLVMTPDIATYAPLVDAVFGSVERGAPGYVPCRIADRSFREENEAAHALLSIVELARGRLTASGVLDVLSLEVVRERFGIGEAGLETIRTWIAGSGIRWGADADHRRLVRGTLESGNTWRFGLDRLLLGYAMGGGQEGTWGGVLPFDCVEGGEADVLGGLLAFMEALLEARDGIGQRRPVGEWARVLASVLDSMIRAEGHDAWQERAVRAALGAVAWAAVRAGFDRPVGIDVVRDRLESVLGAEGPGHEFLSGSVTFCAMLPMRAIPRRIVCLLGMSDEAFPRSARTAGFDLVAREPRPGDRSMRDDDRQLFLEAILSARDRLIVTYTGRGAHDGRQRSPSVAVSDLVDEIVQSCGADPRVFHPLAPWSPALFAGGRISSRSASMCEAARRLAGRRDGEYSLVTSIVPPRREDRPGEVALEDLVRFFRHPARHFITRRLGIRLGEDVPDVQDDEPLFLTALEMHALGSGLLDRLFEGREPEAGLEAARASGVLPAGTMGAVVYRDQIPRAEALAAEAERHTLGQRSASVDIDIEVGGVRLVGSIAGVRDSGQVRCGWGGIRARQMIDLWIGHLALSSAGGPASSILIGWEKRLHRGYGGPDSMRFGPEPEAGGILARLVDLYSVGHAAPLPLFPETSLAYVKHRIALDDEGIEDARRMALDRARTTLEGVGAPGSRPERDAYIDLAFAGIEPLSAGFEDVSMSVLLPLLENAAREEG